MDGTIGGLLSIILLLLGSASSAEDGKEDINVLVLLPMRASNGYYFPFGMEMNGGAVYKAIDYVEENQMLPNKKLKVDMVNSGCNAIKGIGEAHSLLHKKNYTAIIGPSCSEVCKMVARLAVYLNLPCFSSVCQDIEMNDKNHFQTLTRFQGTFVMTGYAMSAILKNYNWHRVGIIASRQVDIIWLHTRRGLHAAFEEKNITVAMSTLLNDEEGLEETLVETAKVSRIIILAMLGRTFRKTMLLIHKHGLDNGDYIFLSPTYYSQIRHFGYYGWDYGDENDEIVKSIYPSVFFISYYIRRENEGFRSFENYVKNKSAEIWDYHYAPDEDVPYGAANLHESVVALGRALNETFAEGGDIRDGKKLARRIWGRSFPSLTGGLSFSKQGDRAQAYMISHMQDAESGKIENIAYYFSGNTTLVPLTDQIVWPNGQDEPPPDTPPCGFDGEFCIVDPYARLTQIVSIFSGVLAATLILAGTILFFVYRHMKNEREIADMKWKIDPHEVVKDLRKIENRSFASRSNMSLKTNASGTQVFAQTGYIQGIRVAIKTATQIRNVDLGNKELLRELRNVHDLVHPNLVKFIGASIELKGVRFYTEYCMKGSLQDVLENSEIELDLAFKCSLVMDIIEGLNFLKESSLKFHGNLKSSSCLVDGRFVVKLNNFGLLAWRKQDKEPRDYLWTAPEIMRNHLLGSNKGDVYSLGIILQEIVAREGPFYVEDEYMTVDEKIGKVTSVESPPFRPSVKNLDCSAEMTELMEKCWAEDPNDRLNITEVKAAVIKASGFSGKSLNIMDNLLQRMEQYANNLEDLVEERTGKYLEEKRRAEDLLHRLLPPSIADEIQANGRVDPVSFDEVTIYFSDIVSFTPICSASTPIQVVNLLNDLYTMFDSVIAEYDVYKVETIGDAYMAVSGLPKRNGNKHVREIALMSLALLNSVKTFKIRHMPKTQLLLRIGLHTGPCVAGVVGLTMPRYCLFGDTVNVASRMESNGEALKIHMSPDTKIALDRSHKGFVTELRGETFIKGKGDIETFWLLEGPNAPGKSPAKKVLTPSLPNGVH